MDDNRLFPLGIQFIFFPGWHYDSVLLKHDKKSPLFRIGTSLPDILYKLMNLSKVKCKSITLDAVLKHNAKVLASGKYTYFQFLQICRRIFEIRKNYLSDKLPAGTMMTIDRNLQDTYDNSIPRCNFRFQPIYTAWNCYTFLFQDVQKTY